MINLPEILVTDEFEIPDIRAVLLAEFGPADLREILMDPTLVEGSDEPSEDEAPNEEADAAIYNEKFATTPVASAKGVRLHRVIGPDHEVVTQYDAITDSTPLDFIDGGGVVLASTRPGNPYGWQLTHVGQKSEDGTIAQILGVCVASDKESAILNEMYPGWLEACELFDEAMLQDALPGIDIAPPLLPLLTNVNDEN